MRRETYDCISRGFTPEVLREITGPRYFDDADIQFYRQETLEGLSLLKKEENSQPRRDEEACYRPDSHRGYYQGKNRW